MWLFNQVFSHFKTCNKNMKKFIFLFAMLAVFIMGTSMQHSTANNPSYVVVTANSILVTPPSVQGATSVVGWVIIEDIIHRSSGTPGQTMVFPTTPGWTEARLTLTYSNELIILQDIVIY
jgi:hypothetical protein